MGGNNMMMFLIILPIIFIFGFMFMKKRKNSGSQNTLNNRENKKDEVWRTIKTFLKQSDEFGKEIVSSFVAKRPNVFNKSATKKIFIKEVKAKIAQEKMDRKQAKIYMAKMRKEQNRELYCILFVTRDAKTKTLDPQRIMEAEVIYTTIKKNERKRSIKIVGLCNFEKEFVWMKPLKEKEDKIVEKIKRRKENEQLRKERAKQRKQQRTAIKQNKKTVQEQPAANS